MSLLSRLFGSRPHPAPERERVVYAGFTIVPDPIRDGDGWRIAARIEQDADGTLRSHRLIRADLLPSEDAAASASVAKAKALIDQQGARIFD